MALPPAIAPAPLSNQHNPAQDPMQEQTPGPRDYQLGATHSPASSRDYDQSIMQRSSPGSPHDYPPLNANNLDPAMGGGPSGMMSTSAESGGDDGPSDGRKGYGKRELSTSKRAAQNRAAQRAFRQRKEGYIKKLEEQVREYTMMNESFKAIQSENYQLRDYIINLQSRLIESQGDYPQPPPNVDLPHPSQRQNLDGRDPSLPRPTPIGFDALQQLHDAAQQDLGPSVPSKHSADEPYGPDLKRARNDGETMDQGTSAQEALQDGGIAIEPRLSNSSQTRDLTIGSVLNRGSRDGPQGRPVLSS